MNIKREIVVIMGYLAQKAFLYMSSYNNSRMRKLLGGGNRSIQYPFNINGAENIVTDNNVSIGKGATIYTTRAKLIIKQHFIAGPNLTVITGDHMSILGRFLDTIRDSDKDEHDKNSEFDKDVIIEEDVWCGANVTILKGVVIGRGAVIAAGSVVTKSIPPYTIAGGIPAKILKKRYTIEQILFHEKSLYPKEKRLTREQLENPVYADIY